MKKNSTLLAIAFITLLFCNFKKSNDSPNNALFQVTIDGTVWKADSAFANSFPAAPMYDNFVISASSKNGTAFFLSKGGLTATSVDFVVTEATLLYFRGYRDFREGNIVTINWSTGIENETDKFIIERSYDAIDFTDAGEVKAAGNSTSNIEYVWKEKPAINEPFGQLYYRLKIVDKDGKYFYSHVISLRSATPALYIYDNDNYSYGFDGSISITSNNTEKRLLSGTFYFSCIDDATGRTIKMENGRFENVPY